MSWSSLINKKEPYGPIACTGLKPPPTPGHRNPPVAVVFVLVVASQRCHGPKTDGIGEENLRPRINPNLDTRRQTVCWLTSMIGNASCFVDYPARQTQIFVCVPPLAGPPELYIPSRTNINCYDNWMSCLDLWSIPSRIHQEFYLCRLLYKYRVLHHAHLKFKLNIFMSTVVYISGFTSCTSKVQVAHMHISIRSYLWICKASDIRVQIKFDALGCPRKSYTPYQ